MAAYGAFAEVYDALMDDFDYLSWADYYLKLIANMNVVPARLCDCACGTGSMSVQFASRGIRVTGVDISGEMLEQAQRKARLNGVQAMFVRQDICALQLPRPVDALVCACDGVNYLLSDQQLNAFFERAHASLRAGGVLTFDISSAYKLENIIGNGFFGEERDDVAYLWTNCFDPTERTATMDISFFVRESGEMYRRFGEVHVQKAHDPDNIARLLKENGFKDIHVYGDRTFQLPNFDEQRIHFVAVRE